MTADAIRDTATVLVVEDEWLIAEATARAVDRLGYRVIGPVSSVAEAMNALEAETPCAVILDAMLRHETSVSVADRLMERDIPFAFFSGYDLSDLPPRFRTCRVLTKPISEAALEDELRALMA